MIELRMSSLSKMQIFSAKRNPSGNDYDSVEVSAGVEHFAWLISLRTDHEIISFGKYRVAVAA